jgi:hypothetical protein
MDQCPIHETLKQGEYMLLLCSNHPYNMGAFSSQLLETFAYKTPFVFATLTA